MNNLFQERSRSELLQRIEKLTPNTHAQWGKMNVAQMLAHCNISLETAMGLNKIPRVFIGSLVAPFFRKSVLGEKPFGKSSPTDKSYIFPADLDFEEQKKKFVTALKNFSEGGADKCTTHPHPFFGKFTPDEWAVFTWKHIDHHLRQFGV